MGQILAWVAWVAWIEILAWVAWVHKILAWVARVKKTTWVNVFLFNHTLQKTLSSIEYDLIVPTKFSKFYSSLLSYLIYFVFLLSK